MANLAEKEHWNSIYEVQKAGGRKVLEQEQGHFKKYAKSLTKKILGENIGKYAQSYSDYLLWNVFYKKYLPKERGLKVLEVGSAPGRHLVKLSQVFGFVPYGIDYSEIGVELNKQMFISNNINPDNVIHEDFLSDKFHKQYSEKFDIVISLGFIEHFNNIEDIIDKHINVLTKGGYLFVVIPNLRGVNYILTLIFWRELLSKHNIKW